MDVHISSISTLFIIYVYCSSCFGSQEEDEDEDKDEYVVHNATTISINILKSTKVDLLNM